jgi:hypothetical protein
LNKKTGNHQSKKKKSPSANQSSSGSFPDDEKSLGSSNAFEATENPQKDIERELSDEELDDLIDEGNKKDE